MSSALSAERTCSAPPIESASFFTSINCSTVSEPFDEWRAAADTAGARPLRRAFLPRLLYLMGCATRFVIYVFELA